MQQPDAVVLSQHALLFATCMYSNGTVAYTAGQGMQHVYQWHLWYAVTGCASAAACTPMLLEGLSAMLADAASVSCFVQVKPLPPVVSVRVSK